MKIGVIKARAKGLLAGHGFICAVAVGVYFTVSFAFSNSTFLVSRLFDFGSVKGALEGIDPLLYSGLKLLADVSAVSLTAVVTGAFRVGLDAWFIRRSLREYAPPYLFFKGFITAGKSALLWVCLKALGLFWLTLFSLPAIVFMWAFYRLAAENSSFYVTLSVLAGGAVLFIGGIVFAGAVMQKYALSRYLIAENPLMSAFSALRESKIKMAGREWSFLLFKLSFFPWFLSCALVLPLFYVVPYYLQSCACFARCAALGGDKKRSVLIIGKPLLSE